MEATKNECISHQPLLKTSLSCLDSLQIKLDHVFPLYSTSWVMFQPNFITDASLGVFTTVSLDPLETVGFIEDEVSLFSITLFCL